MERNIDTGTVSVSEVLDETENDNTISEELSRFSSASESQSSSCTSITNPFYEGPSEDSLVASGNHDRPKKIEPKSKQRTRRTSSSASYRRDVSSGHPCPYQSHHRQGSQTLQFAASGSNDGDGREAQRFEPEEIEQRVILSWDLSYLFTCSGFLQLLQLVMTTATLCSLVSAGSNGHEGGLLNLPLSWHFRIMIFILMLTLLTTLISFCGNLTSLILLFGLEWTLFDMLVYSLFSFLYLVGSSLVASAFDFYQKMKTNVSRETIDQLITAVILGYVCMVLYGLNAFLSYRKWKVQYRLYQRRKLIEEDEIDL